MSQNNGLLLFPHQLFENHELIDTHSYIILAEDAHFFHAFSFHKQKLIFHRATMQAYAQMLKQKGKCVIYFEHDTCKKNLLHLFTSLKKNKIELINYFDVIDIALAQKIIRDAKKAKIIIQKYESPSFFLSSPEATAYFKNKKKYSMAPFYQYMRKKYDILMYNGKPIGGKWSFDTENRQNFNQKIPFLKSPTHNKSSFVKEAQTYIKKYFDRNPGSLDTFIYPVTHKQARNWLRSFLEKKLHLFGTYQDAMHTDHPFGFHSLLSPLLNSGLLLPDYVINETILYARKHNIRINNIEGFIRQILGWREFVRSVYITAGKQQRQSNVLKHTNTLPKSFWEGTTGIDPIDNVIAHVLKYAYAHHIQRLMILGNFMQLTETHPDQVYTWFMELFIDAYDWVMVPNIYGMSQYADGGIMTTKPYCSSSSYIRKMSNYPTGTWTKIWDALYWCFIDKHKKLFAQNRRMVFAMATLKRMKPIKRQELDKIAKNYFKSIKTKKYTS